MKTTAVAALTPKIEAGAITNNICSIVECVKRAQKSGAKIAVLPLNIITGDLGVSSAAFISSALETLKNKLPICCILAYDKTPVIIENGQVFLSNTHTMQDGTRIYAPLSSGADCGDEDLNNALDSTDIIALPSSYPAFINGAERVLPKIAEIAKKTNAVVVCASNGNGNSGYKFVRSADKIIAFKGRIVAFSQKDTPDSLIVNDFNGGFIPDSERLRGAAFKESWLPHDYKEVFDITARGIYYRMKAARANKLIFGLSGGLDSTSVLLFAAHAADKYSFDKKNIIAVRMPSKESSLRTLGNAQKLAELTGVDSPEIPIDIDYRLKRINHEKKDVVYENAQARERAAILLDMANKENALVLGTSDLTEIALGFSTYGGDQLAHFNPNSGLTKMAIRFVVSGFALNAAAPLRECLNDILSTPYSPELKPNQSSEEILGPYALFEFFLLRLCAHKEFKEKTIDNATKEFSDLSKKQITVYYDLFIKRLIANRFKHNSSCDGIALTPFDLSFFDFNSDLNPEFLL